MSDLSRQILFIVIAVNVAAALYFIARFAFILLLARSVDRDFTLKRILAIRRLGLDPQVVIRARNRALELAVNVPINDIQKHYEHGGNPTRVIHAMRDARDQGQLLGWESACRIDLAGDDLEEAARTGLDPGSGEALIR